MRILSFLIVAFFSALLFLLITALPVKAQVYDPNAVWDDNYQNTIDIATVTDRDQPVWKWLTNACTATTLQEYPQCGGTCNGVTYASNHTVYVKKNQDNSCNISWNCQDLGVKDGQCGNASQPASVSIPYQSTQPAQISQPQSPRIINVPASFASGQYTNMCGSGYAANIYSCQAACDPNTGVCSGANVAKFTCDGRQNECGGNGPAPLSEAWSSYQSVNNPYPGCNKTVQVDVFNKYCRDGAGNWTCSANDLTGYMVWYSGACILPTATPTPTPTQPVPTATPTPTPTPTQPVPTATPTPPVDCAWIYQTSRCDYNLQQLYDVFVNSCTGAQQRQNFRSQVNFCGLYPTVTPTPTPTLVPTLTPSPTPSTSSVQGPALVSQAQQPPQVNCPSGFTRTLSGSTIVCVQQVQNQNVQNNASTGPINVTLAAAPQAQPQVVKTAYAPFVEQLPKTGLPIEAWTLTGLIPLGVRLRRFGFGAFGQANNPSYLWQSRILKKS